MYPILLLSQAGYTPPTEEKTFMQGLHELVNLSLASCIIFVVWVFIFAKVLKPFRVNRKGTPKDNTLLITFIMLTLATACTVLSTIIYYDFSVALS